MTLKDELIPTYSQYGEDLILKALLHDVKKGFYVDVGANDPEIDSVTELFYREGWSGINIEPIKSLYEKLQKHRKRDVNVHAGISNQKGTLQFREYTKMPGHSTFDKAQREAHSVEEYKDYEVAVETLAGLLREKEINRIHFLKIDVEGYEYEVISGADWKANRPEVICIEANHTSKDWKKILINSKYKLFINDGLNEYYVAEESIHRTIDFGERVALLSYKSIKNHHVCEWGKDVERIAFLEDFTDRQDKLIKSLQAQSIDLAKQSLSDKTLPQRIKLAVKGLTLDYIRYIKNKR